jgi:hypothetical protein
MNVIQQHIESVFDADTYLDFVIQTVEKEIENGWRSYHAMQMWFKAHLAPPLINDIGRQFTKTEILRRYAPSRLKQEFDFVADAAARQDYRNYLNVLSKDGGLNGIDGRVDFWDKEATQTINAIVGERNQSWGEILVAWSTPFDLEEAKRAESLYAKLSIERFIVDTMSRNFCSTEMLQCLATEIFQGWEFSLSCSRKKSLIFKRPFTEEYAWAIELGCEDGASRITRCVFGLTLANNKRPINANTFLNLSSDHDHLRLKMNKLFLKNEEGAITGSIWKTGADLMYKFEHITRCIDFFAPMLESACR